MHGIKIKKDNNKQIFDRSLNGYESKTSADTMHSCCAFPHLSGDLLLAAVLDDMLWGTPQMDKSTP